MVRNRQIRGVFTFFESIRGKNTVNADIFCTSEAQNHGIYDIFFASNSKRIDFSVFLASAWQMH